MNIISSLEFVDDLEDATFSDAESGLLLDGDLFSTLH